MSGSSQTAPSCEPCSHVGEAILGALAGVLALALILCMVLISLIRNKRRLRCLPSAVNEWIVNLPYHLESSPAFICVSCQRMRNPSRSYATKGNDYIEGNNNRNVSFDNPCCVLEVDMTTAANTLSNISDAGYSHNSDYEDVIIQNNVGSIESAKGEGDSLEVPEISCNVSNAEAHIGVDKSVLTDAICNGDTNVSSVVEISQRKTISHLSKNSDTCDLSWDDTVNDSSKLSKQKTLVKRFSRASEGHVSKLKHMIENKMKTNNDSVVSHVRSHMDTFSDPLRKSLKFTSINTVQSAPNLKNVRHSEVVGILNESPSSEHYYDPVGERPDEPNTSQDTPEDVYDEVIVPVDSTGEFFSENLAVAQDKLCSRAHENEKKNEHKCYLIDNNIEGRYESDCNTPGQCCSSPRIKMCLPPLPPIPGTDMADHDKHIAAHNVNSHRMHVFHSSVDKTHELQCPSNNKDSPMQVDTQCKAVHQLAPGADQDCEYNIVKAPSDFNSESSEPTTFVLHMAPHDRLCSARVPSDNSPKKPALPGPSPRFLFHDKQVSNLEPDDTYESVPVVHAKSRKHNQNVTVKIVKNADDEGYENIQCASNKGDSLDSNYDIVDSKTFEKRLASKLDRTDSMLTTDNVYIDADRTRNMLPFYDNQQSGVVGELEDDAPYETYDSACIDITYMDMRSPTQKVFDYGESEA